MISLPSPDLLKSRAENWNPNQILKNSKLSTQNQPLRGGYFMKARSDYHHSAPILSFSQNISPANSSDGGNVDAWALYSLNLVPLLDNAEITVNLNPAETYSLSAEYPLTKSKTINGNGVTLTLGGPIHAFRGKCFPRVEQRENYIFGVGSRCRKQRCTFFMCRMAQRSLVRRQSSKCHLRRDAPPLHPPPSHASVGKQRDIRLQLWRARAPTCICRDPRDLDH